MRTSSVIVLSVFLAAGCSSPEKRNTTDSDSVFVRYYADRLVLLEEANLLQLDSARKQNRLDSLGRIYGTTPAEVGRKISDLQKDPQTWKDFYDRVVRRIEILQQQESSTIH